MHGSPHKKGTLRLAPEYQKVILFDFDGTLADSLPLQHEALQILAARHNWPLISAEEYTKLRKQGIRAALASRGIPLWRLPFLIREGQEIIKNRWKEVSIFSETASVLSKLHNTGYTLGIITSNTKPVVQQVLSEQKVLHFFEHIVAERNLWKKHIHIEKLCKTNEWKRENIWYVGDEIRDMEAAKTAHIQAVGVGWGLNTPETLSQHTSNVVTTRKELLEYFLQPNDKTL